MKKSFFLLLVFTTLIPQLYSQNLKSFPKNELYGGYAYGSAQEIANVYSDIFAISISFGLLDFNLKSPVGPVFLGYRRYLTKNLALSVAASYSEFTNEYKASDNPKILFTAKNSFVTGMAFLDLYYVNSESFQMYSGGGVGFVNVSQTITDTSSTSSGQKSIAAFQVTAAGFRFGKDFGGFLELGYGFHGILNAGVSYKF